MPIFKQVILKKIRFIQCCRHLGSSQLVKKVCQSNRQSNQTFEPSFDSMFLFFSLSSSSSPLVGPSTFLPGKSGQIQSVVKPLAGPARDGAARRGLPLLQAHAGQRSHGDATHGDAPRQETIRIRSRNFRPR